MSTSISIRLVRLAEQLGDLRVRLQEAARFEVAQAIADAISEATRAFICGPAQKRSASRDEQSSWDDPWRGPFDDEPSWTARGGPPTAPRQPAENFASYHTALMTGLAVARWSFARTGQPAAALGLAAAAAIAVLLAGERIASLLDVCSVTQELLAYPSRRL